MLEGLSASRIRTIGWLIVAIGLVIGLVAREITFGLVVAAVIVLLGLVVVATGFRRQS